METSTTLNKDLVQGLGGHETLPLKARFQDFYEAHFTSGQWINHGSSRNSPSSDVSCSDRFRHLGTNIKGSDASNVDLFMQKVAAGLDLLAARGNRNEDHDVSRLERDLLAQRTRSTSKTASPKVVCDAQLNDLSEVLSKYTHTKSKALQWRVRFTLVCVDIVKRKHGLPNSEKDTDKIEYQRRKEVSVIMMNNIVSQLSQGLGAYCLVLFLVAGASKLSYYNIARGSRQRRQIVAESLVQKLLNMEMHVRRDQLWFHPGAVIAWFLGHSYSEVCETLGLDALADPYLDKYDFGNRVPWASQLQALFERKPPERDHIGGDNRYVILNPNPHIDQRVVELETIQAANLGLSTDMPQERLEGHGPNTDTSEGNLTTAAFPDNARQSQWEASHSMPLLLPRAQGDMGGFVTAAIDAGIEHACEFGWDSSRNLEGGETIMNLASRDDHVWMEETFDNNEYPDIYQLS